jgi:hypothetical protein
MQPLTSQPTAQLANDLDHSISLPASWYTDPAGAALATCGAAVGCNTVVNENHRRQNCHQRFGFTGYQIRPGC